MNKGFDLRLIPILLDFAVLRRTPLRFLTANNILPLRIVGNEIEVLCGDSVDPPLDAVAEIERVNRKKARLVRVPGEGLQEAISVAERLMMRIGGYAQASAQAQDLGAEKLIPIVSNINKDEKAISDFIDAVFVHGVEKNASDIHIEPYEDVVLIRFRIDGVLHTFYRVPKDAQSAVISRIKILADLDIAEKRMPQDGRISHRIGGERVDLRVATLPTIYGERISIRILRNRGMLFELDMLNLLPGHLSAIEEILSLPYGLMLVTGPTGSGKTTSLYAMLKRIKNETVNIITIEDPIEYELKGISQIQVNPSIGLDFETGLKAALRQDPNVIMVGEIRDRDTAKTAVQASLTGHFVLSTLHTNDAPSTVIRLLSLGIEPFLLAQSLSGVLAQRLVRRICPYCRVAYEPDAVEKETIAGSGLGLLYKGAGCGECFREGFLGRAGIFELLRLTEGLREMIAKGDADAGTIRGHAISEGMATLYEDGLIKAGLGITTLGEVLRVARL